MVEDKESRVWTYSGYKANERPVRFRLGEKELAVRKIVDRWYGEKHDYFKVVADDAKVYLLKRDREADVWYSERKPK